MTVPEDIDESSRLRHHPAVAAVELDGEAVLYHEDANTVHLLNPTATVVWGCLDGSTELATVCDELARAYAVPLEVIRGDALATVREFGRQGLLDGVESDPVAVSARLLPMVEPDVHGHG